MGITKGEKWIHSIVSTAESTGCGSKGARLEECTSIMKRNLVLNLSSG